jgi:hypothetical protein
MVGGMVNKSLISWRMEFGYILKEVEGYYLKLMVLVLEITAHTI